MLPFTENNLVTSHFFTSSVNTLDWVVFLYTDLLIYMHKCMVMVKKKVHSQGKHTVTEAKITVCSLAHSGVWQQSANNEENQ